MQGAVLALAVRQKDTKLSLGWPSGAAGAPENANESSCTLKIGSFHRALQHRYAALIVLSGDQYNDNARWQAHPRHLLKPRITAGAAHSGEEGV